jgi:ankyrin repeat protein
MNRRVVQNIIKPATAHSRLRYIHLPGIATAANIGKVDIFLSHAWGGIWGDLVAAALSCLDGENSSEQSVVRVYIDVFAVRQWPGNVNDIVFEGVVKHVRLVLVVVSSRELDDVGNLNFKDVTEKRLDILSESEKRAIPFLRIWCLAEINSACVQNKPLVIACGSYSLDVRTKTTHVFESNAPVLYHMQFLVSVEDAKAQMKEDEERILREVREGVGYDYVNRVVRGAITGALVSSRCPLVRLASIGNISNLMMLLDECYRKDLNDKKLKDGPSEDLFVKVHDSLCASAASGFCDIFELILSYNQTGYPSLIPIKDSDGMTVLMHAVRGGHQSLVERIVDMCTVDDVDTLNNDGWTALAFASQLGCENILAKLLTKTQNVNQVLSGGQIAIGIGLQNNFSLRCCEMLLAAGSNVNHRDEIGYTVLKHAVNPGKTPDLVSAILNANADPNSVDNWGESILTSSLQALNIESMKVLLDHYPSKMRIVKDRALFNRVDVNQVNIHTGLNPLNRAIADGKEDFANLLKSYGAVTVQEVMRENGYLGCGRLLEDNLKAVMKKFDVDRERAGLMLSVRAARLDWTLDLTYFPKPFDTVSTTVISETGRRWGYGIVTRGPDWDYDDTVDGGTGCIGYIQPVNQNDIKEQKVRVKWPLSGRQSEDFSFEHRAGKDGKYDLCYAPYKCNYM